MVCIRGAITVTKNNKEEILSTTEELLKEIMQVNNLDIDEIVSIIFTATKDLDEIYPAVAARNLGIINAGLMCFQEMYVKDSLPMCIRVMLQIQTTKTQKDVKHIYMKGAKVLRPDINYKE